MTEKIYCKDCKYFKREFRENSSLYDDSCLHFSALIKEEKDNYYEHYTVMSNQTPHSKNKNNDCEYFEVKNRRRIQYNGNMGKQKEESRYGNLKKLEKLK